MPIDIASTVAATITAIAPFMPFLADAGKAGTKKFTEVVAAKGGEAAWAKAQNLWARITNHFPEDTELVSAANIVAANPEDELRQTMLADVLGARLTATPDLAAALIALLGGQMAVQEVIAARSSWVRNVKQRMEGSGSQKVQATDDSIIEDVDQHITRG